MTIIEYILKYNDTTENKMIDMYYISIPYIYILKCIFLSLYSHYRTKNKFHK